jgi:hypothetical protein
MAAHKPSVEDHMTCSICLELYSCPLRLPCEHCFCKKCLVDLSSGEPGSTFKCPECRRDITLGPRGLNDFPKSLHLTNIVETYKTDNLGQCMVCEKDTALKDMTTCTTCNGLTFCKGCQAQCHPRTGDLLRHQVRSRRRRCFIINRNASFLNLHSN